MIAVVPHKNATPSADIILANNVVPRLVVTKVNPATLIASRNFIGTSQSSGLQESGLVNFYPRPDPPPAARPRSALRAAA